MSNYTHLRNQMVRAQIVGRGLNDVDVLEAMRHVPREVFVEPGFEEFAYDDRALPIREGQTISQPYIVALMIQAAGVRPGDRVLEIGAGSGYAAAVMGRIATRVYAVERHLSLANQAKLRFRELGYHNISVRHGDGVKGWPEAAPFQAILVAAAASAVPVALKLQLAVGGRLVIPVGPQERVQTLLKITRTGVEDFDEENLGAVLFVPLLGE